MKQRSGLYPRLSVDDAGSQLVSQAGAVALVDTVRVVGLDTALSAAVGPWRKPLARHDPAKVMLDLALSLAIGGDCLADVAVLREQPAVFGLVASDPTVSRTKPEHQGVNFQPERGQFSTGVDTRYCRRRIGRADGWLLDEGRGVQPFAVRA